jgi:enterochelin esterase family protein
MLTESTIIVETLASNVLRQNPLGDPHIRRMPVYLPPGYHNNDTRYPVVYLLTGFAGRGTLMVNDSIFDENIQEQMDRLIAGGTVQPMILAMPDGLTRYGGSQYINSAGTGRYQDYIITEIVPYIDQTYRTRRDARIIAGKSSGGYGALVLAMRHPDVFRAVACHSGDMYFDFVYRPDFIQSLNAFSRHSITSLQDLRTFLDNFHLKMHPKPAAFFDIIHAAGMASCYSPNPNSPCGFDLPWEIHTGQFNPAVWQRWLAHDPLTMLDNNACVDALRSMQLVFIDCGNRDEYNLHYGARLFSQRLAELNIDHIYEEFDGGHRHTQFRYDVSLQAISQAFAG